MLFEGRAGAEVLAQSFVPLLLAQRPPDTDNPRAPQGQSPPFLSRIGLRVMSDSFSVSDRPSLRQFDGKPLPGSYEVDDEGVPGRDVTLIENGRLMTLLTSRTPQRNLLQSNGHGRGSGVQASVVQVRSARSIPAAEMKAKYLDLLRVQDKEFGYIVRGLDPQSSPHIVKVARDGRETVVRGVRVGSVLPAAFRDILEASSEQTPAQLSHRRRPGLADRPRTPVRGDRDSAGARHHADGRRLFRRRWNVRRAAVPPSCPSCPPALPPYTVSTTFPVTFRDAIICSASAARSSGNVSDTCGFSLPC